ncbi:MAG TPA: hypothetical protein VG478_07480 [Acidimicrobiales bacterium]|jgi:hypothetical protein|nr:hypothetical protein [Acidimicrobiales bacterium]
MWPVVLVLCLMVAGFAIVALLAATRPSARPDVVAGAVIDEPEDLRALDAELAAEGFVASAPRPTAVVAAQPPAPVIDD